VVSGEPLQVAVVGTGRIGALHAEILSRQVGGATLAAVADVDTDRAGRVGTSFRVPARPVEEILDDPAVDAVAICSSASSHVDLIVAAAQAGKAIFCEKPISLDLAQIDRALAVVERMGAFLQVGFNRRFDPAHRSVRDAVADGTVGDVHLVRISSRDPEPPPLDYVRVSGGIFLDMTIHDFDMARFVTGTDAVEVFARGAVRIMPELADLGDLDTAVVVLTHTCGAYTVIDNSRQAVYGYDQRVEAFGSRGVASSENALAHTGVIRTVDGTHGERLPHFFLERYVPSYVREWDAFVAALRDGQPSPVPGADGRAPLAIGLAARRSALEGRPVRLDEIG
jgi:myo-inositol 2-dehydrogenase/D-chiro-inositol 1-dehydrogenase